MKKIVLIDICGTLYDSNTTMDFLEFSFRDNPAYRQYQKIVSLLPIRVINKCFLKLFSIDPIRAYGVHFLKGLSRAEIDSLVEAFYINYLLEHRQQNIIDLIDKYRNSQYRLVIVSATLDCIAHKIAKELNISTVLSSSLEYNDNGICTGRIATDLLFAKCKALQKEGICPPFGITLSDNLSDADLMKLSDKSFIVCREQKKDKWLRLICKYNIQKTNILIK